MDASLKRLLVSDILIRFCEQIPYAFVVVWCMQTIERPVSAFQFGLLTAIEMATAVLVYIPVAHLADKTTKKPFVMATFVFFTFFPLVLLFCRSFVWLIPAKRSYWIWHRIPARPGCTDSTILCGMYVFP